jgi:exodeoxyribonuclease-5
MLELSDDQNSALRAITDWYGRCIGAGPRQPGDREERLRLNTALTLGGYAGTGKTTLIGQLESYMSTGFGALAPHNIVYASYTGKAVSVLKSKLPNHADATTLHRLLYRPQPRTVCKTSGEPCMEGFYCQPHTDPVVNEVMAATKAGTLSKVKPKLGCETTKKLDWSSVNDPLDGIDLVVVDEASMIGDKIWQDLTKWGVPVLAVGDHAQLPPIKSEFNLMSKPDIRLERILRQAEGSPIIRMSIQARRIGNIRLGDYGQGCVKIPRHKMSHYEMDPAAGDLVICAFNNTRNQLNDQFRMLLDRKGLPQPGDIVICLRNSYENGIFNGMRGVIKELEPRNDDTAFAVIEMLDEGFDFAGEIYLPQFGAPKTCNETGRWLSLFDYGYVMTCHKAQGSQADRVMVIEERLPQTDYARWLYTAVTRAAKELIVVGH